MNNAKGALSYTFCNNKIAIDLFCIKPLLVLCMYPIYVLD